MIVTPKSEKELGAMQAFMLSYAGVQPSADAKYIGWVTDNLLQMCVAFTGFMGKVCQCHIAMVPNFAYMPRELLEFGFDYLFNLIGREMAIGIVNSKNVAAMKFDLHIGFEETFRIPSMHDDGGDIVVLTMRKEQCRYLKEIGHA